MLDSLRRVYSLFSTRDKVRLLILMILTLIGSLWEVIGVGIVPAFVVAVANPDRFMRYPVVSAITDYTNIYSTNELLLWGVVAVGSVFIFKNVYLALLQYIKLRFLYNRRVMLSNKLFEAYLYAPYTFHLQRNTAQLFRNVKYETEIILNGVLVPLMGMVMRVFMILGILGLLVYFEPLLSLGTLLALGLTAGIFLNLVKNKTKEYGKEAQRHRAMITRAVMQGLGGLKETKVLNTEKYFLKKFEYSMVRSAIAARYHKFLAPLHRSIIETVCVIGLLGITVGLVSQGREIETVAPLLVLFGAAAMRIMPAIRSIVSDHTTLQYNLLAVEPVYEDFRLLAPSGAVKKAKAGANGKELNFKQVLELNNVSYKYPNSSIYAVKDLSLAIERGQCVGFVGASGAGKTTAVDLILGLLQPDEGRITVDGVDIRENVKAWQRNIGYIPQFIYLLDDTIRRNIAFGLEDHEIDEEKLQRAVHAAQLTELVHSLPEKLETVIGERGIRLSGGQRQRIGIARALYHNPQVLVMDEATSSLDNITESYIIDALDRLRGDRTVLIVAHRLTTVRACDRLFFMKEGRVEVAGRYDELQELSEDFRLMSMRVGASS